MSRAGSDLEIAGIPRVDLVPEEFRARQHEKVLRRRMVFALFGAVIVVAALFGVSTWRALQADASLAAVEARGEALLAQQQDFIEVRQLQNSLTAAEAARRVTTSSEIDWAAYLAQFREALAEGNTITGATVTSATPIAPFAQVGGPLQASSIASVELTVRTTSLPDVSAWLGRFADIPGVAAVLPSTVTELEGYTVTLTVYLDADALSNRFAEDGDTE
jgi:hypothetical protein